MLLLLPLLLPLLPPQQVTDNQRNNDDVTGTNKVDDISEALRRIAAEICRASEGNALGVNRARLGKAVWAMRVLTEFIGHDLNAIFFRRTVSNNRREFQQAFRCRGRSLDRLPSRPFSGKLHREWLPNSRGPSPHLCGRGSPGDPPQNTAPHRLHAHKDNQCLQADRTGHHTAHCLRRINSVSTHATTPASPTPPTQNTRPPART